jgi:hypothetical protein
VNWCCRCPRQEQLAALSTLQRQECPVHGKEDVIKDAPSVDDIVSKGKRMSEKVCCGLESGMPLSRRAQTDSNVRAAQAMAGLNDFDRSPAGLDGLDSDVVKGQEDEVIFLAVLHPGCDVRHVTGH